MSGSAESPSTSSGGTAAPTAPAESERAPSPGEPRSRECLAPGLEGVKVCRSSICSVDGEQGILEYRGIRIEELARHSTFEETTYLLLHNHLPSEREFAQFCMLMDRLRHLPPLIREGISAFPAGMSPMMAMQAAVPLLQGDDYYADDTSNPQHNLRRAITLIARMVTLVAAFERRRHNEEPIPPTSRYSHAGNFLYMLTGEPPDPEAIELFDRILVLHAEHGMNNSTFSARVIGSTDASIYSAVSGAIGALSGKLHGGANVRVIRMLYSIGSPDNVESFVEERMATKGRFMGIGHRIYRVKDPRASILQELIPTYIEHRCGEEVKCLYATALRLEEVLCQRLGEKKLFPNVDFYSGIALEARRIPSDLFTVVFAVSRIAGWCAHWLEQIGANRLFRPSQEYIGDHNRRYVPIEKR